MPLSNPINFDSHPFEPRIIINPIPCEIDGISMGTVSSVFNTVLCFTLHLATHQAKVPAKIIEMNVAVIDTTKEFDKAVENLFVETI